MCCSITRVAVASAVAVGLGYSVTLQADEIEIGARNIHPDEDPLVAVLR